MRALMAGLLLSIFAAAAFAQAPDPLDSVIVESKFVLPVAGPCASAGLRVKVYITNKDSLAIVVLVHETRSVSGGAYAIISRSASCSRPPLTTVGFDFLYPPGPGGGARLPSRAGSYSPYHSKSPDTFLFAFTLDNPGNNDGKMPPNLTRTLLGEIKFDTVLSQWGQFEIDSGKILANTLNFVDLEGNSVPVNFAKGVITLLKGDFNADGQLTGADFTIMLNCVFCSGCTMPFPSRIICDMNCNGLPQGQDVILLLNRIFLGTPFPC